MQKMSGDEVFIVEAKRTPIGRFQGALSGLTAPQMGAAAIKAVVEAGGVTGESIELAAMGNVLTAGVGQAPARQAVLGAGLPSSVRAVTVGKVCGSGLEAVVSAAQSLRLGEASLAIAGGQESMSQAPYLLPQARAGFRMGHQKALDSMIWDGLWDPYGDKHMGNCAEICAAKYQFSRNAQDEFAIRSYEKAQQAWKAGHFQNEVVALQAPQGRESVEVTQDEEVFAANFAKIPQLRPAFQKDGTVTAANASKINDGAAALLLASGPLVQRQGWKPRARIVASAGFAQEPEWFTTAPVGAMKAVLKAAGLTVGEIDLFEINEAFAVVTMAAIEELNLDPNRVNVHGGAVALGHPIGASGARILVSLVHALETQNKTLGLASICIGGGEALAVLVERVN